jgi:hypothetical protein
VLVMDDVQEPQHRPRNPLASHWVGEHIEYASSDQFITDTGQRQRAHPHFESSHRHEETCRCLDCRMYWWHVAREHWRHFERTHGQIPPRLDPREHTPAECEQNERARPAVARRQALRARRWFQSDLPPWLFCVLAGLPNPRDDAAAEDFDETTAPTMSAHAEMMELLRVTGAVVREREGHCAGERDTWAQERLVEIIRDAERGT